MLDGRFSVLFVKRPHEEPKDVIGTSYIHLFKPNGFGPSELLIDHLLGRGTFGLNGWVGCLRLRAHLGVSRIQRRLRGSILHSSARAFLISELAHY
jgi:hypothetical protein